MKLLVSKALWEDRIGQVHDKGLGAPTHYEYRVMYIDERLNVDTQKIVLPQDQKIVAVLP